MKNLLYKIADFLFYRFDQSHVRRSKQLSNVPDASHRKGGKKSLLEWGHVIGLFQTLIYENSPEEGTKLLDIGSGTGLLPIAAYPTIMKDGKCVGIEIQKADVEHCRSKFDPKFYEFIHFDVHNATYAKDQQKEHKPWPIEDGQFDTLTALSVWTHFNEEDAHFYLKEAARVLKSGGRAIISFFVLDDLYEASLASKTESGKGKYHNTPKSKWVYDLPAYDSENWMTTSWAPDPEAAIAIKKEAFDQLIAESGFKLHKFYPGNWKEVPGLYFQDVVVLEKQ